MIDCPKCGTKTAVIESRRTGDTMRRRRECKACKERFTTYEVKATHFTRIHVFIYSSYVVDRLRCLVGTLNSLVNKTRDDEFIAAECNRLANILTATYHLLTNEEK